MIIGTAGHVDHGKSALIAALTGADTDRLPEEKARGISIDLGFAYLPIASGAVLGFVDVPGHERFMKNMLAGAGGIDCVLLVVAADDGIMPQTREHLAVVDLLGVRRGLIAITKCDLVSPEQIAGLEGEITALLQGTGLEGAPMVRTSAASGEGIAQLRELLERETARPVSRACARPLRFAIDRAFTLAGAGTVVTGVIVQGSVAIGDTVMIAPSSRPARVRALHVQGSPASEGLAGERCGINLGRTDLAQVSRGDWLIDPALQPPADRINAELRLLDSEPRALNQWQAVRLHHGAAELPAHIALLRDSPLAPGEKGLVQVVLEQPISAAVGDRFVIRDAGGQRTMGGGRLIDLRAPRRRRRQAPQLARLAAQALPDPAQSLAAQLAIWPWSLERDAFLRDLALSEAESADVLAQVPHIAASHEGITHLFSEDTWKRLKCSARGEVSLFHQRFPQLLGPNLARLRHSLGPRLGHAPAAAALAQMVREGLLAQEAGVFRLPNHQLGLDRGDETLWHRIEPVLAGEQKYRPPRVDQLASAISARDFDVRRVLKLMAREGRVAEVAPDHFFAHQTLREIARILLELASETEGGEFGAAQLRDRLDNGRKVAIQLLEWFDRQSMTARRGDLRVVAEGRIASFCEEVEVA